jgi:hypothetical protein
LSLDTADVLPFLGLWIQPASVPAFAGYGNGRYSAPRCGWPAIFGLNPWKRKKTARHTNARSLLSFATFFLPFVRAVRDLRGHLKPEIAFHDPG